MLDEVFIRTDKLGRTGPDITGLLCGEGGIIMDATTPGLSLGVLINPLGRSGL